MPKRITNMESGVEIILYSLYDIASKAGLSQSFLRKVTEDETIETPPPAFAIGSDIYWNKEAIDAFILLAAEDREKDSKISFTKIELVDRAIAEIKQIQMNVSYQRRKIDYRESYNQAMAVRDFIKGLSNYGIPDEKDQEMNKVLHHLRTQAGV